MTDTADTAKVPNSTAFDYTIVYDTVCGWCYGAARVLEAMVDSGARIQLLHRYLFQGNNAPQLADGYATFMTKADARIAQLTGAQFSDAYARHVRNSPTEQLESGYTADAASLIHELGPTKELEFSRLLQQRRFIDGTSAQNREDIVDILIGFGVDRGAAERVGGPELRAHTQQTAARAIAAMDRAGAVGVPAIIAHCPDGDELIDVSRFYDNPATAAVALSEGTC